MHSYSHAYNNRLGLACLLEALIARRDRVIFCRYCLVRLCSNEEAFKFRYDGQDPVEGGGGGVHVPVVVVMGVSMTVVDGGVCVC